MSRTIALGGSGLYLDSALCSYFFYCGSPMSQVLKLRIRHTAVNAGLRDWLVGVYLICVKK